jgi:PTH1 family peptidyl-tRNA hydrolase
MHLVLGLGNPGRRYEGTRHNAGFLVVDRLAGRWQGACDRDQLGARVGAVAMGGEPVVLAKPQSFMNRSGAPAASLRAFYKVADEAIVVVHDEIDLPFGTIRVKRGGGHGGHNGLRDLHDRLGTKDYLRVRFGVSRPPKGQSTADHVLSDFAPEEAARLEELVERAADAVELVVQKGVQHAMNTINIRVAEPAASVDPGAA